MDFYIVLGVERGASLNDIKRAYKRLARKFHPDINPGDRLAATQFRQIAEAYETLSDPDRRRRYDSVGASPEAADAPAFGFEGFDFSVHVGDRDAPTFGDLFADIFQPRAAASAAERGVDLHHTIALTFEQALRGAQQSVTVTRQEHCRTCKGVGVLSTAETRCPLCQGTGIVKS